MTSMVRVGLVVGLIFGLALGASCGTTPPTCTPSNCASGCCDLGTCQPGTSITQCGSAGNTCAACSVGEMCQLGTCVAIAMGGGAGGGMGGGTGGGGGTTCGPQNCAGCCSNGTCLGAPNNGNDATCGKNGNACVNCSATSSACFFGTCTSVDAGTDGGIDGGTDGGTTCTGCVLPNSTACVPLERTSVINCGTGGARCAACSSGQLCVSGSCINPPSQKKVGDTCNNDGECQQGIGSSAICKQMTVTGNGTYTGGYCTVRCTMNPMCPSGSSCVTLNPAYGEESMCMDTCSMTDRCRTPGYSCYAMSGGSSCWISPTPPLDAGTPADKVGNACASDSECINPPEVNGVCLLNQFNASWPSGYCSKLDCLTDGECSTDGGAICQPQATAMMRGACMQKCEDSSDAGQSTCRAGYRCAQYSRRGSDGGVVLSSDGVCTP